MTTDDKICNEKLQHNIKWETAKILAMYQEKLIIFIRNNIYQEKLTNMNVLQVKKYYLLVKLDQEKK